LVNTKGFEAERARLFSVAHRVLGSVHDAEDALQTAWLHVQAAPEREIDNMPGWLTTVVTRVCLDQLRDRHRREVLTRRTGSRPTVTDSAADEEFLLREDVSRALMVLLERLTPPQRVAFVLHDLFTVPFDEIAAILDTSAASAKKHASRARARIRPGPPPVAASADQQHQEVVAAFLRAAAGGDIARMIELMAPDCVRIVDSALVPPGTAPSVTGAVAVADETRHFVDRIRCAAPMHVNGRAVHVIAPGGHAWAIIDTETHAGVVTRIAIRPVLQSDALQAPRVQARENCDL
jgi:RNA polymerase sigma-70 factor (ECF subfamily)